ncbi:MAG: hypothetical protein WC237_00550 [Candidatus Paceibacterota bacterium]|jgi:hypothetical protein
MTKNKAKKEIKITHDDLKFIYGDEYVILQEKIIPNCFCTNCPPPTKYGATMTVLQQAEVLCRDWGGE